MIRSFDPAHVPVAYNVVTMPDGAALVDAGLQGERGGGADAPAGCVAGVEVQHHPVSAPARAVEHQPFGVAVGADDDPVSGGEPVGDVGGGAGGEVGFQAPPVAESVQDAQFSPRNISVSVPIRRVAGSQ